MKTKIKDIFSEDHDRKVISVSPKDTVYKAIQKMAKNEVGSVIVLVDDKPVGIFTERDYMNNIILRGLASKKTKIEKVMTKKLAFIRTGDTVEKGLAIMNSKKCRHLPVCEEGELYGMVSLGELVRVVIKDQKTTIEYLNEYISMNY
ncbi:MAG: CBS domain-containing protein [Candidatus Aminicenantes bacterium]|nr:CBS domain-containing protein [Candidatus Aminicenantes bacterium]